MTEAGEQLAVTCPACSPDFETIHEVVSNGGQPTVQCRECGHVHTTNAPSSAAPRSLRTIVSQDGESIRTTIDVPPDAVLETGDRFVVETEEAVYSVELTSIEDDEGGRHDTLQAERAETLWTRDIGNLSVNVTIHPQRGSGDESRSASLSVPGDEEIAVGDSISISGTSVRVIGVLLRDSAVEAGRPRKLDETGDTALAMDLDRVYARPTGRVRRDPW